MFNEGEKIFHPLYGVLLVEALEEVEICGETTNFFVMHTKGAKIMVPTKGCKKVGLRSLTKSRAIDKVLSSINDDSEVVEEDWSVRFKLNEEKVRGGAFTDLTEVVRDMYWVEKEVGLNKKEKELYNQVHHFLVDEVSIAKQLSKASATKILNKALWGKGK